MSKRMSINIVSVGCSVIAYLILFLILIIRLSAGSYGPIVMWGMLLLPLIGFIISFFGEKGTLNTISLIANLSAIIFCSVPAAMTIFVYLNE